MSIRARRLAAQLHRRLGSEGPPASPSLLLAYVALEVVTVDWPHELGAVLVIRGDTMLLALNRRHSPVRRHFSFWHEIGHYLLHGAHAGVAGSALAAPAPHGHGAVEEREANVFATHVLMPEEWVRRYWLREAGGPAQAGWALLAMARRFQVSAAAMDRRLRELGLSSGDFPKGRRRV